jgi:precorrin-3B C17-methyltransferase
MSQRAKEAILTADAVVGYTTYIDLIRDLVTNKEVLSTGMMREVERCKMALEVASEGKKVAVVSSGDPGIYGMAGLVLELAMQYEAARRPEVNVIPGISAVGAAAAVLGAPLMHDFAVISLSDLLTPWDVIIKRVEKAAEADFVMAIYNPKSKKRITQIEEVQQIALRFRPGTTPVGIVREASRPGQHAIISTLSEFTKEEIDMFSLVIIGNSHTFVADGKMITPRGYTV